jgi:hypothetical protein
MRTFFIVLLCLGTRGWAQPRPGPSSQTLVFTNVNVVDTRYGRILPGMTVVVRDGQIQGVARFGLITETRNVRVINATGQYMIPGLWDMDVHTADLSTPWDEKIIYPLYVANGVTGVRDMGGDPDLLERRRQRIEDGTLRGPHILFANQFLSGGESNSRTVALNNPADAPDAVATLKERGVNLVMIRSDLSRESYLAFAEEAAKLKIRFEGPIPDSITAAEASAAGHRSIERLSGIPLGCSSKEDALRRQQASQAPASQDVARPASVATMAMATYDPGRAWNLFVQLSDNNTWQVPALISGQTMASMGDTTLTVDPRLKYVPVSIRREWELERLLVRTSPDALEREKKQSARELELVNTMRRAGVQFMAGSDGPGPYVFPGFSLHAELEWLVQVGFTPTQALQSATLDPALFLAKLDKFGVVEAGHAADLVLLEANPLEDIRNTSKIAAVIVTGKYYSRQDLDKMLAQVAETARNR